MSRRVEIMMWLGLFAAPAAWAASHLIGWAVSEAHCEAVNRDWGLAFQTWETVILVLAAVFAVCGIVGSALTYRQVKSVDNDADPPAGRLWLLSISGLVVGPLMLILILLTHIGALALSACHQG